jgi:ABC-type multidrug transport system fused ATPase/permease subunit
MDKMMRQTKKDIVVEVNANMDENMKILDGRIYENEKAMFRRAVIALLGGLGLVMFGYAYVHNKIAKRYDINFYEKMMDAKIDRVRNLPYAVSSNQFYNSVTQSQFDKRHMSPEEYFTKMSESDEMRTLKSELDAMQKLLIEKGIKKDESSSLYSSITNPSKAVPVEKKKKGLDRTALINTLKIMLIIIAIGILAYVGWNSPKFFGGAVNATKQMINGSGVI